MFYARTNKNNATKQITRLDQRQRNLRAVRDRLPAEINDLRPLQERGSGLQTQQARKRKRGGRHRKHISLFPSASSTLR